MTFLNCFIVSGKCDEPEENHHIELRIIANITNIYVDNGTALIDVILQVRNFTKLTSNVELLLDSDFSLYNINCSGNPSLFTGHLEDKNWRLVGYGELFPFDFYTLKFRLFPNHIQFPMNETVYGLDFFEYSFENESRVEFSGFHKSRLDEEWDVYPIIEGDTLTAYMFRSSETKAFQFVFPIVLIQVIAVLVLPFTDSSSVRVSLYSSILLFTPMFIFAIQDFVPPRSSLSIPEFFGIVLIFSASVLIAASTRDEKKFQKNLFLALDVIAIFGTLGFFILLKMNVYGNIKDLISLPAIDQYFVIVQIILIVAVICRVLMFFAFKHNPKNEEQNEGNTKLEKTSKEPDKHENNNPRDPDYII